MTGVVRTVHFEPASRRVVSGRRRHRLPPAADGLAEHLALAAAHLPVVGQCGIGRGTPAAQLSVHDNFSELRLVVRGSGAIALGGTVHALEPGSLVVMGPGDEHQTLRGETERLSVHFYLPPPPPRRGALSEGEDPFLRFVLEAYPRAGVVRLPPGDPVFAAMHRVIAARREGGVGADLLAGMALVEVLIHLARRVLLAREGLSEAERERRDRLLVHELQQAVRARLAEPIAVGALLAAYPLAPNYLRGIFKRLVGCSLQDWWQRERMGRAMELLRAGAELAEVARRVGFEDYHYFLKRFKAVVGVSPGEWRRREGL